MPWSLQLSKTSSRLQRTLVSKPPSLSAICWQHTHTKPIVEKKLEKNVPFEAQSVPTSKRPLTKTLFEEVQDCYERLDTSFEDTRVAYKVDNLFI
jgi:hypothetical protein